MSRIAAVVAQDGAIAAALARRIAPPGQEDSAFLVEAVAHHHAPTVHRSGAEPGLAGIVHLADTLIHERSDGPPGGSRLDSGYVEAAGLAHRLGGWRAEAVRVAA